MTIIVDQKHTNFNWNLLLRMIWLVSLWSLMTSSKLIATSPAKVEAEVLLFAWMVFTIYPIKYFCNNTSTINLFTTQRQHSVCRSLPYTNRTILNITFRGVMDANCNHSGFSCTENMSHIEFWKSYKAKLKSVALWNSSTRIHKIYFIVSDDCLQLIALRPCRYDEVFRYLTNLLLSLYWREGALDMANVYLLSLHYLLAWA